MLAGKATVTLFDTDDMQTANCLLFPEYFTCDMMKAEHPDWVRLRGSDSLVMGGVPVPRDSTRPEELLYDLAHRLGMNEQEPAKQVEWMVRRAQALHWVIKLAKQGCFASVMYIVGNALFGEVAHSTAQQHSITAATCSMSSAQTHCTEQCLMLSAHCV